MNNNQNNLCSLNPTIQTINQNPHTRNTVHIVTEQIILFHHVSKNAETKMIKEKPMRDQNLHKNVLYNVFVPTPTKQTEKMREQTKITTNTAVEVHHETAITTKITAHRTDTSLHHAIEITMTEVQLRNIILVQGMIIINEILYRIVLLIDHRDHLTDAIFVVDTNHVPIQEITILQDILLLLDLLQNQEILNILSPALTLPRQTKSIQYKLNHEMILLNFKYICITLKKWLKNGSTHYTHIHQKDITNLITISVTKFLAFYIVTLFFST